jgi:hypothetical protein
VLHRWGHQIAYCSSQQPVCVQCAGNINLRADPPPRHHACFDARQAEALGQLELLVDRPFGAPAVAYSRFPVVDFLQVLTLEEPLLLHRSNMCSKDGKL